MRIAIIGGGAAGMMCAATINEEYPDVDVFLIEKNAELGKKVIISGGGRCNVTTGYEDIQLILKKYPRGDKFLQIALRKFSPKDVRLWFENHGVPLKCEEDMRVFPVSDDGHDIVGAFKSVFSGSKTKILYGHNLRKLEKDANKFILTFKDHDSLGVDRVVMACGGQAYRQTGSTGDGYAILESLGHKITPLAASLNSFITAEKWPKSISGLSFSKATISVAREKKYSFTGPFLFTHAGVSGPAVFALSSLVAFEEYSPKKPLHITIDLLPDIKIDELQKKIKLAMQESPKKSFKNTLHIAVPMSLAEIACNELQIPFEKKNAEISNQTLADAVLWIKKLHLSVVARGAGDEFVTAGGVDTSEVDPRTMESKICPGLYFAGEILNVDGFTGGFNLQASWATGRTAGLRAGSLV